MTVLLIIIYLAFISLGLPDSILGVSLPAFQAEWGIPLSAGGLISLIIVGGTIISSFISGYIIEKLGTGKVVFFSCLITGASLLGFSLAPSYIWLLLLAVPLGLGAGSVDTALNNYVALHFKAHHMNWLHSFWGVGATLGPVIMSYALLSSTWRMGYRSIAGIQLVLAFFLLISLPLWKSRKVLQSQQESRNQQISQDPKVKEDSSISPKIKVAPEGRSVLQKNPLKIKGAPYAFLTMFLYCAVEYSIGLWGSSFLVHIKGLSLETAASWMALYYGGITIGRFFSGFISFKLNNIQMIRWGIITAIIGILLLFFPLPAVLTGGAFVLAGLGLSPVFPSMLHETPRRFGPEVSQKMIGFQMGFGYMGSALFPSLMGLLLQKAGVFLFPYIIVVCILLMILTSERLTLRLKR